MPRKNRFSNTDICFLQYSLPGGGAERKICTLANFLVRNGYSVEIGLFGRNEIAYVFDPHVKISLINRNSYVYSNQAEKWLYNIKKWITNSLLCCPIVILERLFKAFGRSFPASLSSNRIRRHFLKWYNYTQPIRAFVRNRPDAVLITMLVYTYNEMMSVLERDYARGKINNPYLVMECNNPTPGLDSSVEDDLRRNKYYPKASRVLVMTQRAKDYFNDEIREKCIVIPNPVRDDLPEPYFGLRRKTVVTYCRLAKQKNLPLLINAFARFQTRFPEYTLEIYGDGDLREELNQLIQVNGIEEKASIQSFNPQIHQLIRDCAMFVSSSDWEGFPNSVLEALALGIPVIATDCDFGPNEMIEDHVNGLLVPVGNIEAMEKAMAYLAENESRAAEMGKQAIKSAEKYSIDRVGKKWISIIDEVRNNTTLKNEREMIV